MAHSKDNFSPEVRQLVYDAQNGFCKHCLGPIVDFHHRLPNNKTNRKLFPLFIQSPFNCVGLCRLAHETGIKERHRITLEEARAYEDWLQKFSERK